MRSRTSRGCWQGGLRGVQCYRRSTAAHYAILFEPRLPLLVKMGLTNGCTEASVLSERGRQAHIKNLPMTYFIPIMDMLKNPW